MKNINIFLEINNNIKKNDESLQFNINENEKITENNLDFDVFKCYNKYFPSGNIDQIIEKIKNYKFKRHRKSYFVNFNKKIINMNTSIERIRIPGKDYKFKSPEEKPKIRPLKLKEVLLRPLIGKWIDKFIKKKTHQ